MLPGAPPSGFRTLKIHPRPKGDMVHELRYRDSSWLLEVNPYSGGNRVLSFVSFGWDCAEVRFTEHSLAYCPQIHLKAHRRIFTNYPQTLGLRWSTDTKSSSVFNFLYHSTKRESKAKPSQRCTGKTAGGQ